MLEKERFLEIKELAHRIRRENEALFESLSKVSLEEAIKEKEEFIEAVINGLELEFSDGELGKEEIQIFRANVLIPDDVEFFQTYSKDKNIRNLMNKYLVNIEDVMSKITELNIYGKYNEVFNEEKEDFVKEMIKETTTSRDEAMDLLDEIRALTSDIDEALGEMETPIIERQTLEVFATPLDDIEEDDETEEPLNLLEPEEIPTINIDVEIEPNLEKKEVKDEPNKFINVVISNDQTKEETDLNDMNAVVVSFIEQYKDLECQNKTLKEEVDKLKFRLSEISSALEVAENKKMTSENENANLKEENIKLSSRVAEMEALISKIYNCVTQKA